MVLDPKAHNEYGTIYPQEFLSHPYINNHKTLSLPPPISPTKDPDEPDRSSTGSTSAANPKEQQQQPVVNVMTDHHQRQPLIPSPTNTNKDRWKGSDQNTNEDYEDESSSSEVENARTQKNPEHIIVKISDSALSQRFEPSFPEERWKTAICMYISYPRIVPKGCNCPLKYLSVPCFN